MMEKLLITSYDDKMISVFYKEGKALEIHVENRSLIGNVYLARVSALVPNIEAAFLEIIVNNEKIPAFYSLRDNKIHNFADGRERSKLAMGDEIVVQISKDAVKTKAPIASAHLSFCGQYVIVSRGSGKLCFSSKIDDRGWKDELADELRRIRMEKSAEESASECEESLHRQSDFLIRTSAYSERTDFAKIFREAFELEMRMSKMLSTSRFKKAPVLLQSGEAGYMTLCRKYKPGEVITDDETVKEQICSLEIGEIGIRLHRDKEISLDKLYSVRTLVDGLLQKKVWMKSGAYLVIEYTEAMTVIDVNSGKIDIHKEPEETRVRVNLEAAVHAMEQIRLRNISGIILIDFIDMKKEHRNRIFAKLEELAKEDRIKTNIVDFTSLGLVEITRQRTAKTIYEEMGKK